MLVERRIRNSSLISFLLPPVSSFFLHSPQRTFSLLGAVEKSRQAAISFVTSIRRELISHWTDFYEIWYKSIFGNSFENNSGFF